MKRALQGLLVAGPDLRDKVRQDKKLITIREGHRDYSTGPVLIGCPILDWVEVRVIDEVRHTTLDMVTEEEFNADGFKDQEDMLDSLIEYYPDLTMESEVTIIRWLPSD
jgi:hypothetical protein